MIYSSYVYIQRIVKLKFGQYSDLLNPIWCQFHQHFLHAFIIQTSFLAAFSCYVLALAQKFCTKNVRVNVDVIDTWLQLISEQNFNRSPELGSSFINRLLFVWYDKTIWNGRKKTIEQSDLWDLNPEDRFVCVFIT